jgi:carboxymethylenebutenolidase
MRDDGRKLMGEMIGLIADAVPMPAYVSLPPGAGPHPGVVLLHHQHGIEEFCRDFADRLAAAGYAVIAPDNFHHAPPGLDREARKEHLDDAHLINDVAASVAWLRSHPRVAGDRLAVMGHCMGGRATFLAVGALQDFRAAVVWYGGGTFRTRGRPGPTPFDRMDRITCPVLGFFGTLDKNPSPADVEKIDAKLTAAGVPHDFHSYDGVDHAFCNFRRPERYNAAATEDSRNRMLAFLARHLAAETVAA